jgi:hypothetical protein
MGRIAGSPAWQTLSELKTRGLQGDRDMAVQSAQEMHQASSSSELNSVHLLSCADGPARQEVQPVVLQLAVLPHVRSSGGVVHQAGDWHNSLTCHGLAILRVSNLQMQSEVCPPDTARQMQAQVSLLHHARARSVTCMLYEFQNCTACIGTSMSERLQSPEHLCVDTA